MKGFEDHPSADGFCSNKLRELCYDLEDFVDAVAGELGVLGRLATEASTRCGGRRRTGTPAAQWEGWFRPSSSSPGSARRVDRRSLVGVDGPRDEFAKLLLAGEKPESSVARIRAVAIVGDAGVGKTKLADEVYRAIGARFDYRAWVSASRNRSWESILIDILGQVAAPQGVCEDGDDLIERPKDSCKTEGCKDLKNHNVVEIAGLVHLRYLSIRDTPISELPDQIGQLQSLTTRSRH
ncbi:hypothetical protein BAE44_0000730 [Dichanthelium oligosanthes]|uniref:Uncharacterized protein n=1 Tax=Dichanthelium oligosanthes TaxID=888268 RepID=A0A1E5WLF9_9POAL|nr:hypothetical protein BAE44_0000730 [Dichanthelium oligosanthes]